MTPRGFGGARALALAAVLWVTGAVIVSAQQTLESRVRGASGEVVQFHFAARPGVCGDGRGLLRIDGGIWTTTYGNYNDLTSCMPGPVRATLTKDGADVLRIQFVAGPVTPLAGATDLGTVSATDAARYFLDLARRLEGRPARSAVLGAALADSADVSEPLLALARDADRARDLRSTALTWAVRRAGVTASPGVAAALEAMARDVNERQDTRSSALSGLASLDGGAGVAALIRLTERTDDVWLASNAVDALSRSNDARVRPQLRKVLEGSGTPEASRVKVITALGNSDGTVRDAAFLRTTYPRFSERERSAAISAVGNIGDRASVAWLLERARDPAESMALRRSAVQRAARAGVRAPELGTLYEATPEAQLREAIIDALAADGSKPALDKLVNIAQSNADARVRRRAVTKLGESGDPRAKDLLQAIVGR